MIISVASGKGGTGKTTVSTSLAVSLPGRVLLMDCDVEAPNVHLFINPDIDETIPVNEPVPDIDLSRCTFCKKCMDICRYGALAVMKQKVLVFENHCHSCGGCIEICPENAVQPVFRSVGEVETGKAEDLGFVHGRLGVGQVMAPPVIRKVKTYSDEQAVTIIDAPPGTSCPVITAVNKTDFIILVTEPTPFGLHDLALAVETARTLNIPHGIVINRAGLGDNCIHEYAGAQQIPILMEIPFEKEMARIYSNGGILANELPDLKVQFLTLYRQIESMVAKESAA